MTGSSVPMMASTMATKLSSMENDMFSRIVVIIRCESAIRCGSSRTSLSTSAMSAASTAMSLPTLPIAMPMILALPASADCTSRIMR